MRRGRIPSELLMCSEGVCSILLLLVARCLETIIIYKYIKKKDKKSTGKFVPKVFRKL